MERARAGEKRIFLRGKSRRNFLGGLIFGRRVAPPFLGVLFLVALWRSSFLAAVWRLLYALKKLFFGGKGPLFLEKRGGGAVVLFGRVKICAPPLVVVFVFFPSCVKKKTSIQNPPFGSKFYFFKNLIFGEAAVHATFQNIVNLG